MLAEKLSIIKANVCPAVTFKPGIVGEPLAETAMLAVAEVGKVNPVLPKVAEKLQRTGVAEGTPAQPVFVILYKAKS